MFLDLYIDHRGEIPEDCSTKSNVEYFAEYYRDYSPSLEWVSRCLKNPSQTMILDELSPRDVCYMGIAASEDNSVRQLLVEEIAIYRSPFQNTRADNEKIVDSAFSIDSLVCEFLEHE